MVIHKDYPCHVGNYQRGRAQPVSFLVFHYVGATGGAEANAKYYGRTPGIGASAHYFVGHASEGAAIWQSVAEGETAWHCGAKRYRHPKCRNANSIGIEMCCHQDAAGGWYIDEDTMAHGCGGGAGAGHHGSVWDSPGERAAALRCHREALPPASH